MRRVRWNAFLGLAVLLAVSAGAWAQQRPYIGYVYPAGGQQGTTVRIRLGGQGLDGVDRAMISGPGIQAKFIEYYRRMSNEEVAMLQEQVRDLRKGQRPLAAPKDATTQKIDAVPMNEAHQKIIERIEKRLAERVQTPACASISTLAFVEITVAPDAPPGAREIRLASPRGVSNALVFHVGQLPEFARNPMRSSLIQVLGKEELALRKRPPEEAEANVVVPCILNGQIASGEVNRYRFEARKGQKLVFSVDARELIPFIANAVPGWFQPVLTLYNSRGREVAYDDDYRYRPDPVIYYEVPEDGPYVLCITDAIYRGREDFVYRITVGETPFVTSLFPLGRRVGSAAKVEMKGWNLAQAELSLPPAEAGPGIYTVTASRDGLVSNRVHFALDTLPEVSEAEPNNDAAHAQNVKLPVVVNGRIQRPDDRDVFQFAGKAGQTVVAEVFARRLDSPLDSFLTLTDQGGKVLAANDDHQDPEAGINTHDADSCIQFKLPADGAYFLHLSDAARHGGPEYAYRLRISEPRPDFALLAVPSSLAIRAKNTGQVTVQAVRKDGFDGPIALSLKNPPAGFSSFSVKIPASQSAGKLTIKTSPVAATQPVDLVIEGRATIGGTEIVREAVAVEDRMQAFLWRHLVPAQDLKVLVFDYIPEPPPKRVLKPIATQPASAPAGAATKPTTGPAVASQPATQPNKGKFSKFAVASRIRDIRILRQEGLITEEFANRKLAECEAEQ